MTNEQLAELIQEGNNDELLPLLWDKTKALIFKKCGTIWRFYSEKLERFGYSLEDLQQESYNALIFAVGQYKAEKEYKFTTYLSFALKSVIRRLLSGSDVLDRANTASLSQPIGENKDGEPLLIEDIVADETATQEYERIDSSDEYAPLYAAIDSLPEQEREIINLHYFKGLTVKAISERLGVSYHKALSLDSGAIRMLQRGKLGKMLRDVYGDEYGLSRYCEQLYPRHKGLTAFKASGSSEVEDFVLWQLMNEERHH